MYSIRDIMTVEVVTATKDQPLSETISLMADKGISCVVVVEGEKPVGVITERDLVKRVLNKGGSPDQFTAGDVMTAPVISIKPDIPFSDALSIMEANHLRRLVVVEDEGLTGLVTNSDIVTKTRSINLHNQRLVFYQNIQSYVIFAFFLFIVLYFVWRFLF